RTEVVISGLPGEFYRVYFYSSSQFYLNGSVGHPDSIPIDADKPQVVVVNPYRVASLTNKWNTRLPFSGGREIVVPTGGGDLKRFVKDVNYAVTNVLARNGEIVFAW